MCFRLYRRLLKHFFQIYFSDFTSPSMNLSIESFVIRGQLKRHEIGDFIRIHLKGQEGAIKFHLVEIRYPIHLRIV